MHQDKTRHEPVTLVKLDEINQSLSPSEKLRRVIQQNCVSLWLWPRSSVQCWDHTDWRIAIENLHQVIWQNHASLRLQPRSSVQCWISVLYGVYIIIVLRVYRRHIWIGNSHLYWWVQQEDFASIVGRPIILEEMTWKSFLLMSNAYEDRLSPLRLWYTPLDMIILLPFTSVLIYTTHSTFRQVQVDEICYYRLHIRIPHHFGLIFGSHQHLYI